MNERNAETEFFNIRLSGLATGSHEYNFQIEDKFFENFENEEIKNAAVQVRVVITKRPNIAEAKIEMTGKLSLICDRCLSIYEQPMEITETAVIKQSDNPQDNEINIIIFDTEKGEIVLDQYFYDMLITNLPLQRAHLKEEDCDQDMIKRIEEKKKQTGDIDPRWNDLKNLI